MDGSGDLFGPAHPPQRRSAPLGGVGRTGRVGELGSHVVKEQIRIGANRLSPQLDPRVRVPRRRLRAVAVRASNLVEQRLAAGRAAALTRQPEQLDVANQLLELAR